MNFISVSLKNLMKHFKVKWKIHIWNFSRYPSYGRNWLVLWHFYWESKINLCKKNIKEDKKLYVFFPPIIKIVLEMTKLYRNYICYNFDISPDTLVEGEIDFFSIFFFDWFKLNTHIEWRKSLIKKVIEFIHWGKVVIILKISIFFLKYRKYSSSY